MVDMHKDINLENDDAEKVDSLWDRFTNKFLITIIQDGYEKMDPEFLERCSKLNE